MKPCSIAIYGKFCLHFFYQLRLFSGLQIVKILSVNYLLHFGNVKIHKHCLYCSVVSSHIDENIIFNYLLLFTLLLFTFLLVSKLYESSQQIPQLFCEMLRNWGKVYIWGILVLPFITSSIPTFQFCFSFFSSGL